MRRPRRDRRRLVDLQAEAVAGAVEEALHAAVLHAGAVAAARRTGPGSRGGSPARRRRRARGGGRGARPRGRARRPPAARSRGAAAHHRAREVAEVAGPLRARKDVHDDRRVRADRARGPPRAGRPPGRPGAQMVCEGTQPSAMMRVFTARAQVLGGEAPAVAPQLAVAADAAGAQRRDARPRAPPPPRAARPRSRAPRPRVLISRSGQNGSGSTSSRTPARVQLHGQARAGSCAAPRRGATSGRAARARSPPPRSPRARRAPRARARRRVQESTSSTRACCRARSISRSLMTSTRRPPLLDEEERVGREEARRVEDVGVGLGRGVEEARRGATRRGRRAIRRRARAAAPPTESMREQREARSAAPRSGSAAARRPTARGRRPRPGQREQREQRHAAAGRAGARTGRASTTAAATKKASSDARRSRRRDFDQHVVEGGARRPCRSAPGR